MINKIILWMIFVRVLIKFLYFKLTNKAISNKERIIINHLFSKSFKFSNKSINDRLIVIKFFKSFFKIKVIKSKTIFSYGFPIIFDSNSKSKEIRLEYIKHYKGHENLNFISYQNLLYFESYLQKIFFLILILPLVLFSFFVSQFYENRSSFALIFEYPIVLNNLINKLKSNNINELYYFSIFEKESNFFSDFIMKNNVLVNKISSDTPLALWNQNIICNNLILCNYYQREEYDFYKDSILTETIEFWGPELSFNYKNLYNNDTSTPINTLGFYSTASWVRDIKGHINQGVDFLLMEKEVLNCLKSILVERKNLKLYIFLHPKEKTNEFFSKSLDHYQKTLGLETNFELVNEQLSNAQLFDKVDLAVAFNSTLIHERLYCGFKSVLFPNNPEFPIVNSTISGICANSKEDLKELILESLDLSINEFFNKHDLISYTYRNIK